jgi:hypothetical protein
MKLFHKLRRFAIRACVSCACLPLPAILLKWDAVLLDDLKGYKVYYGANSQQYDRVFDAGNATQYLVNNLQENTPYYFAVTAYDTAGNESAYSTELLVQIGAQNPAPTVVALNSYNFPNPFRPNQQATQIRYYLPAAGPVKIAIYSLGNRLVRTLLSGAIKAGGEHVEDAWNGLDDQGLLVANGVYLCKIQTPQFTHVIKIAVSN